MKSAVQKPKRIEMRLTTELYDEIIKFCQRYSMSTTAGLTWLVRKKLNDTYKELGLSHDAVITPILKAELMRVKPNNEDYADFVERVLRNHVAYADKVFASRQQSPFTGNPTTRNMRDEQSQFPSPTERPFDYWDKRIAECEEHDYDEQEKIRQGVENEQGITDKQRQLLKRGGTRRQK